MPPNPSANPVRRKGPAFKPPRPVKAATGTGASKAAQRAPIKPAARTSGVSKKQATSRPSFQNASTIISSSSEEDDANENESEAEEEEEDVDMDDVDRSRTQNRPAQARDDDSDRPAIPPPLLARLLHEGFEDSGMKIQKEAMAVVGKYMETFVREAVARAAFEREGAGGGMGVSDGFLQVEDLEKLAPQLVLDF